MPAAADLDRRCRRGLSTHLAVCSWRYARACAGGAVSPLIRTPAGLPSPPPSRPAMPARNQPPPWSSFPVETHGPMISLWADLLRRWLASRARQEEMPHDHLAQDRAAPLAAATPPLCPAIDTSATPAQPGKHPPPISARRAGAADGLAGRAGPRH